MRTMYVILLLLFCTIFLLWILSKPFYWKGKKIKYLIPKPIVGNMAGNFTRRTGEFMNRLYYSFPDEKVFGMHTFGNPTLFIRDPDLMVEITNKAFEHFTDSALSSNQEYDLSGGSLLLIHGEQWREVRTKVSHFFTPMKVKKMLLSVDVTFAKAMQILDRSASTGEPCDLGELIVQITTDVITQSTFGVESDAFEKDSKFKSMATILFSAKTNFMFIIRNLSQTLFKYLRLQSFDLDCTLFLKKLIRELVDYRQKNNVQANDFVQGIIEVMEKYKTERINGKVEYFSDGTRKPAFDFDEMFLQAFIIFVGGVESSATSLTWLFYELALNQELQERCKEEVRCVIEKKGCQVTLDDMSEIPLINAAVKEALRMYPAFSLLTRMCTKTYRFEELDLEVEPGTFIFYATESVQRDPKYFPDPDTFNPDRFIKEETGLISTFGLGPRTCLGKSFAMHEMILVICRLLQYYKFTLNPKTKVPLKPHNRRAINSPSTPLLVDVSRV